MGLDTGSCYITRHKSTAMEFRYLNLTFKSERSIIGLLGAIALEVKGPLHILEKESCMNSDIYINQALEELGLPFYKKCIRENRSMIWMDDGADYHASKTTFVYCRHVELICIDWPGQSPDFNPLENLCRIIKVRDSAKRYRIRSLKSMEEVIKEEWEKMTEEDFWEFIERMHKQWKLVIPARSKSIKYWGIHHIERSKLYHVCKFQVLIYIGCRVIQLWISRLENFDGVNSLLVGEFLHTISIHRLTGASGHLLSLAAQQAEFWDFYCKFDELGYEQKSVRQTPRHVTLKWRSPAGVS